MPTRRDLIAGLGATALLSACGAPVQEDAPTPTWRVRAREALAKGAGWLWQQQSEHGHWRSAMYGPLRSGQSLTPFALLALTQVPAEAHEFQADKASLSLGWLKNVRSKDGAIGFASSAADYPVYATSLALSAAKRLNPAGVDHLTAPMHRWLLSQQLLAGWEDHPAHGGFPMGTDGEKPSPPTPGHVDLSMTRRAVEALMAAGEHVDSAALTAAQAFIRKGQRSSGAFVYSHVEDALNKGVRIEEEGSSDGYGTATADGLLALMALGITKDDAAITHGLAWLHAHHRVDENPGVGRAHASFGPAMKFCYRAASARVFSALGGPTDWQVSLCDALREDQADDGSWANAQVLQKEDEPVIATAFAITALSAALA
ncbi:MAG: terpene cyclase/mutase family protein [Proteobacteria bacterium]|nr:terpene cyclase/mutase family protein [Pseudomonadota bacterium]